MKCGQPGVSVQLPGQVYLHQSGFALVHENAMKNGRGTEHHKMALKNTTMFHIEKHEKHIANREMSVCPGDDPAN